jgi:hypothetical protein
VPAPLPVFPAFEVGMSQSIVENVVGRLTVTADDFLDLVRQGCERIVVAHPGAFFPRAFIKQRIQVSQGFGDQTAREIVVDQPEPALGVDLAELFDERVGAVARPSVAHAAFLFSDPVFGQCSHVTDSECLLYLHTESDLMVNFK